MDITAILVEAIKSLCECTFESTFISNAFLTCFDENSSQYVTLRAVLTETNQTSIVELVSYIKQWSAASPILIVQNIQLHINTTCPVAITYSNVPECPEAIDEHVTSSPVTLPPINSNAGSQDNNVIVIGVIAGVLGVIVFIAAVISITMLAAHCRKNGSHDIQHNTTK